MSRTHTFPLKESDLSQLEDVTQSLECLEHLLLAQDVECYDHPNPQHLAALFSLLVRSQGQIIDNCRRQGSKARRKNARA